MKNFKKILVSIMIPVMISVLMFGIYKNNVYASPKSCRETPIKIAVFLDNADAMYISLLKQNLESIEKENKDKVKFTFFNAKDNQSIQNESIDKAIDDSYDIFIINTISPNLKDVEDTFRRIMEKNIPIILNPDPTKEIIDFVKPYKKFVVVGADFEQSGTMEGKILADEWNSNKELIDRNHDDILQYVILKGRIGSPLTYLRTKYSLLALNQSGIKTEEIDSNNCEWSEECAKSSIASLFLTYGNKIEAIIANNDAMAVGAVKALQQYGYNKGDKSMTIPVVGIDGMPEAKEFIQKDYMAGTVIVEPHDLAEVLYTIGINLVCNRDPLENTNYKFDDTGYTVHLNYTEYTK
ncbi:galactose ABC transporter substrate-binding protein [Clostridium saccharobutylicum]|uniref:D-galactose/methyl-galactoside binding periplasmic protein MglB n=1 Tax=Clostridium saccharobutylicum TaxID=169679 RepID=A0A1S8N1X5_CLOSA|nr:galactose ABC transporter substrate-binding protein [Clostridium saccharobutylicum]OOM10464.1 D-galactose-binding periplasmic protein precursor [Clostridium saccharobutylicum]